MTAECTCLPYSAGGYGPEEDCPVHGTDLLDQLAEKLHRHCGPEVCVCVDDARDLLPVVRAHGDQRAGEQSREAADERAMEAIRRVEDALDALSRETNAYEAGYKGWALQVIRDVRRAIHGADHGAVNTDLL